MLKYLILQLDDTSTSFCHYTNLKTDKNLISLSNLEKGIFFAMKENLSIQYLYPRYPLPIEYKSLINKTDHINIVPFDCEDSELLCLSDVIILEGIDDVKKYQITENLSYLLRLKKNDLFIQYRSLQYIIARCNRVNIIITDIEDFTEADITSYNETLSFLIDCIVSEYKQEHYVQVNLLTDRIFLNQMNNCNAGDESIALMPDGNFYVCPAFYFDENSFTIGNLDNNIDIRNKQLYRLDHAPICKICDAWHCKRCIWLNRKMTLEVNTPSHEQCLIAHLERNASIDLLHKIKKINPLFESIDIPKIDYLDPFEKLTFKI